MEIDSKVHNRLGTSISNNMGYILASGFGRKACQIRDQTKFEKLVCFTVPNFINLQICIYNWSQEKPLVQDSSIRSIRCQRNLANQFNCATKQRIVQTNTRPNERLKNWFFYWIWDFFPFFLNFSCYVAYPTRIMWIRNNWNVLSKTNKESY